MTYRLESPILQHLEVASWRDLAPGDAVILLTSNPQIPRFAGKVDAISADGSFLWLLQNNAAGRKLFHRGEGFTTLLETTASRHDPPPQS